MKDLKKLLEESILDIDGTLEEGDKYENLTLTDLYNSQTQLEFETKFNVFRLSFESDHKGTEIYDIKPRKTYIVFVENTSMKRNDPKWCRDSIYIGTTKDLYRLTWINGPQGKMEIKEMQTLTLDDFIERKNYLNTSMYICPKKIKDEVNKIM